MTAAKIMDILSGLPGIDLHHFLEEEMKFVGELSQVCSQIVPKC